MATIDFEIVETIIGLQHDTNVYNGEPLDIDRVIALWRIIEEENNSQMHLIQSKELIEEWKTKRKRINGKLEAAENPTQQISALADIIKIIADNPVYGHAYKGYTGIKRGDSIHVDTPGLMKKFR